MQLYKKLSRENKQLPRNQRLHDPDYSLRDWLELIAEGLMFPQTISPIGKRVMDAPYIAGISQGRHEVRQTGDGAPPDRLASKRHRHVEPARPTRACTASAQTSGKKRGPNSVRYCLQREQDTSYRTHNLGVHYLKFYGGADPGKNHYCRLCREEYKKAKNPQVFCVYCQASLCKDCWSKWHKYPSF